MTKKKKKLEDEVVVQSESQELPKEDETTSGENGEEITPEDDLREESDEDGEEQEQAEDSVDSLKGELEEQKDKYIRLMAEFDNYKRRTSKEYERMVELANERLMHDIIEVRESFSRALTMAEGNDDFTTFLEGMKLIFTKLEDNLKKNGLEVFAEVGDEFDPEIHDAMMKAPHNEVSEDCISEIYEQGYKLKNHVIKHAKVIVSDGAPKEPENKEPEEQVAEE